MIVCCLLSHRLPHPGFLPHRPISFPRLPSLLLLPSLNFVSRQIFTTNPSSFIFSSQNCMCHRDVGLAVTGMQVKAWGQMAEDIAQPLLVLGGKVRLPLASEQSAALQHLAPASDTLSLSSSMWQGKQQRKHLRRMCLSKISRAKLSLSACTELPVLMHDSLIATQSKFGFKRLQNTFLATAF